MFIPMCDSYLITWRRLLWTVYMYWYVYSMFKLFCDPFKWYFKFSNHIWVLNLHSIHMEICETTIMMLFGRVMCFICGKFATLQVDCMFTAPVSNFVGSLPRYFAHKADFIEGETCWYISSGSCVKERLSWVVGRPRELVIVVKLQRRMNIPYLFERKTFKGIQ